MEPINIVQPQLDEKEFDATVKVLKSGHIAEDKVTNELEEAFARYTGAKNAVFVTNGTSALHLALEALDIPPGSEIITTAFTFIASSNSAMFIGAIPKFVDIDPKTFNLDPDKIEAAITDKTKAIMPVHIFGMPADMPKIMEIARKHDLLVIEDAAQAHGGRINNNHVGTFGDIGCFSFYATKNMISGEGGMVITNNDDLADKCRSIKNHGRAADSSGGYAHFRIGYNFRAPDFVAAVALEQLKKLPMFLEKRKKNAKEYYESLNKYSLQFQEKPSNFTHGNYICAPYLKTNKISPTNIISRLKTLNIHTRTIYSTPTYQQPAYTHIQEWRWAKAGIKYPDYTKIHLPVTEMIAKQHFEIPVHPGITDEQRSYVINSLQKVLKEFNV